MREMSLSNQAYFDALSNVFEFAIDPVQLVVGGNIFDVKSIEVENKAAQIMDKSDVLVRAKLQDGREMVFLASRVEAFISGRAWE